MRHPSRRLASGWALFCSQLSVEPYNPKGPENVKITTLYRCTGRLLRAGTHRKSLNFFYPGCSYAGNFAMEVWVALNSMPIYLHFTSMPIYLHLGPSRWGFVCVSGECVCVWGGGGVTTKLLFHCKELFKIITSFPYVTEILLKRL